MKTTQEQVDELSRDLVELTREHLNAVARLAKLESGKAEVKDGGELEKIRNTVGTYARGIGLDRMPTSGVVGYLLHAYYGLKNARELTVTALGTDYDDAETIAGNVARVRRKLSDAQRERDEARVSVGRYIARIARLKTELAERTDELGAAQRLIAETDGIDDDAMVAQGDPVKGAEAEELQQGIRDLIKAADSNDGVVSWHALQSLLDRVNARDSNAFLAQREKAPRIIVAPDKAAALREAGWEERVSGWSPDGGYSTWTLDGAYDAMVAARKATPARLDPDGTEKPLTRIMTHPKAGDCVGPCTPLANPEYEAADGTRTPLATIATPKSAEEVIREAVAEAHAACVAFAADLATPRDTMTQPEPGDLYVEIGDGDVWMAGTIRGLSPADVINHGPGFIRPATTEEAADIRRKHSLDSNALRGCQ